MKTIGQRSGSSNRARSGRRHDRQQSNGPLAKHNREQSGPLCNRAIGSPAQSIPSVDHAGRPESCNEYDRALSSNCHNLVQSGSRPTSQGAHAEAAGSGSQGDLGESWLISWSSTECLGTLQSGTLSDRAQSGGHKNRIESCSWACRAIGLVFLSGATGQTARLANARLLPDRLSCQIAPDINRAIGARLARSPSSDQKNVHDKL